MFCDQDFQIGLQYEYKFEDNSITSYYLSPIYEYIARYIPKCIPPNLLTIMGFLCVCCSYYICDNYFNQYPEMTSLIIGFLTIVYVILDSLDGKHARRIKCSTIFGELLDHVCDNVSAVLIILNMCCILDIKSYASKYLLTQIAHVIFIKTHADAIINRKVIFGKYNGPCEYMIVYITLCFTRSIIPIYVIPLRIIIIWALYWSYTAYTIYDLSKSMQYQYTQDKKGFLKTKDTNNNKLSFLDTVNIVTVRIVAITFILMQLLISVFRLFLGNINLAMILSNGMVVSMFTSQLILCKIFNKNISCWIMIIIFACLHHTFAGFVVSILYHIYIFSELSFHLGTTFFSKRKMRTITIEADQYQTKYTYSFDTDSL